MSVIIPTHNRKPKLVRCLSSVLSSSYPNIEVIVVDDCSDDGTIAEMKQSFPEVRIVTSAKERLLAGSRNIGVVEARGQLTFFVDDDNIIRTDTIAELVRGIISDPTIGVAGPLMYYAGTGKRIWCAVVRISYLTSKTTFVGRNEVDVGQFKEPLESDGFPNAFMVQRNVFNKIGLFNETEFPIHYDEADFCRRAQKAGYRIRLIPAAKVEHDVPFPRGLRDKMRLYHVHNRRRAYYAGRNRVLFHRKYCKPLQYSIFAVVFLPLLTLFYARLIIFDKTSSLAERLAIARSYLSGTLDGLQLRLR